MGDSTSMGYGANPGPNNCTTGIPCAYANYPGISPNFTNDGSGSYIYLLDNNYLSPVSQANMAIPSGIRLLESYIRDVNASSRVYNLSISGGGAAEHVTYGSVAQLATEVPKPDVVFIVTGINSIKRGLSQDRSVQMLITACINNNMLPILVKSNNIAMDSRTGSWYGPDSPNNLSPPANWIPWTTTYNWRTYIGSFDTLAAGNNIPLIDLGSPDGAIDVVKLYDPFHPNAAGYNSIFLVYKAWLGHTFMQVFYFACSVSLLGLVVFIFWRMYRAKSIKHSHAK